MTRIPDQEGWKQYGQSDLKGSIWSSMGLDLVRNMGAVRVSPRTRLLNDNTTDLGITAAFAYVSNPYFILGTNYYWAVSGKYVWNVNSANGYAAFSKVTASGAPDGSDSAHSCADDISDAIGINYSTATESYLMVTTNTDIYRYAVQAGTWSNKGAGTFSAGTPHKMCVKGGKIYITNQLKIYSTDATLGTVSTSGANTLDIGSTGLAATAITTILPVSDGIWVFTVNQGEKGCWAFKWDGVTATDPNSKYFISDCSGILAGVIINDTPWVIDNNGALRIQNGGTFELVSNGQLPVDPRKLLKNSLATTNTRWIHPNGISTDNGRINILINNENADSGATIQENLPSGVWEFSPETGWYHKMSLSQYTGSVTDYGQNRVGGVGALYIAKTASTSASSNGTMLLGGQYYSDASTTRYGIWTNDANNTIQKYGYLVTPKFFTADLEHVFKEVSVRHKPLLDSSDLLYIKYRIGDVAPVEATITWTSTTTFTTTTDVSAYYSSTLGYGYEVEVIQGKGSGKCAQITSIVNNAGTYTVTVDSAFTGASSGTAKARFQYWIKAESSTDQVTQWFTGSIGANSAWIQLKLCMQFTGPDEVNDMLLESSKHL